MWATIGLKFQETNVTGASLYSACGLIILNQLGLEIDPMLEFRILVDACPSGIHKGDLGT